MPAHSLFELLLVVTLIAAWGERAVFTALLVALDLVTAVSLLTALALA
jgi:hypothetical protein